MTSNSLRAQWNSLGGRLFRTVGQVPFALRRLLHRVGEFPRLGLTLPWRADFVLLVNPARALSLACRAYCLPVCRGADGQDCSTLGYRNCEAPIYRVAPRWTIPMLFDARDKSGGASTRNDHSRSGHGMPATPNTHPLRRFGQHKTRTSKSFAQGCAFAAVSIGRLCTSGCNILLGAVSCAETQCRRRGIRSWYNLAQWPPNQVARALGCFSIAGAFRCPNYSTELLFTGGLI